MNRQILGGSHSSVEPMDDLMEMDFSPSMSNSSNKSRNKNAPKAGGRSKSFAVSDYVSMSPSDRDRLSVPGMLEDIFCAFLAFLDLMLDEL